MPFVVDSCVTLAWAFEDEDSPGADAALLRLGNDEAIAPALWWLEVRNTLVMGERRRRITVARTTGFLLSVEAMKISLDRATDEATVMDLARRHRLTVYDAAYLELALRRGASLATLDGELARAAGDEGVELVAA